MKLDLSGMGIDASPSLANPSLLVVRWYGVFLGEIRDLHVRGRSLHCLLCSPDQRFRYVDQALYHFYQQHITPAIERRVTGISPLAESHSRRFIVRPASLSASLPPDVVADLLPVLRQKNWRPHS